MRGIQWKEHLSNVVGLRKIVSTSKRSLTIRRQLKFHGQIMINESLENITFVRHIEGKRRLETVINLLNGFMRMNGKTGTKMVRKELKITYKNKRQQIGGAMILERYSIRKR